MCICVSRLAIWEECPAFPSMCRHRNVYQNGEQEVVPSASPSENATPQHFGLSWEFDLEPSPWTTAEPRTSMKPEGSARKLFSAFAWCRTSAGNTSVYGNVVCCKLCCTVLLQLQSWSTCALLYQARTRPNCRLTKPFWLEPPVFVAFFLSLQLQFWSSKGTNWGPLKSWWENRQQIHSINIDFSSATTCAWSLTVLTWKA